GLLLPVDHQGDVFRRAAAEARSGARGAAHGAGGRRSLQYPVLRLSGAAGQRCERGGEITVLGEHDPEKWRPVFPRDKRETRLRGDHARNDMTFTLGPRATSAGYRLEAFDQIGSTNVEAIARARGGDCGSIWFVTSEQTAGRGRRQRAWIAPRGNLASSVLEVLNVTPSTAATLGFAAGLAIEAALREGSVEAGLRAGPAALRDESERAE